MSTNKEIFNTQINNIVENINELTGTTGKKTVAQIKIATDNMQKMPTGYRTVFSTEATSGRYFKPQLYASGSEAVVVSNCYPETYACLYGTSEKNINVEYNDGTSKNITIDDTFTISYNIPTEMQSTTGFDFVEKLYFFDKSIVGQEKWKRKCRVYSNGVEITDVTPCMLQFTNSSTSTSVVQRYVAVDNWQLKINDVIQKDVYGISIEGTSASYFDARSRGGNYISGQAFAYQGHLYTSTTTGKAYGTTEGTKNYILNGIICYSSTYNETLSNYPLASIVTKLFTN